ncbi:MAG: hypothetical protein CM15mP110_5160 [Alphaproteobacteria bacterium]|nr:MAG: hypothetical protein CM15mP110_5160 [Alphaproteobacteria bacterium]
MFVGIGPAIAGILLLNYIYFFPYAGFWIFLALAAVS